MKRFYKIKMRMLLVRRHTGDQLKLVQIINDSNLRLENIFFLCIVKHIIVSNDSHVRHTET